MHQTLCDLVKQQNIVLENNINRICFREIVMYANRIHGEKPRKEMNLSLYNAPDSSAGNMILFNRLIHFIMTYFNANERPDVDSMVCSNEDLQEPINVGFTARL